MKKILMVALVVMLMIITATSSFAAGAFVASPSGIDAPKLISATNGDLDCTAELILQSYSARDSFDAADKAKMEAAYNSIKGTSDLSTLNADLVDIAKKYDVTADKLVVSDLFNVTYTKCNDHSAHGAFTITVKPQTLDNYVAVMHFNGTEWEVVESEVVDGYLTFVADDFSPYAIVAHDGSGKAPLSPAVAGGISGTVIAVIAVAAVVVGYFVIKKKKA